MRKFTSFTAAAAVLLTSVGFAATPAEARGRYYGGYGRHHDRVDAGDVIGGILVFGAIAAILGAASKAGDRQPPRDDRYEPPYRSDDGQDSGYYDQGDSNQPAVPTGSDAETRASDACSWAAEGELSDDARVDRITEVQRTGDGWYVTGVASRNGEENRSFGCTYRGGRVVDVRFN